MLFEIDTAYCSRCKKFVPIFDAKNVSFSLTEINCNECGKILFVMRSELEYEPDDNDHIEELEEFIRKENIKTASNKRLRKYAVKTNAV